MRYKCNIVRWGVLCATAFSQVLFLSSCKDELDWLIGTPINVTASSGTGTRSSSDIQTGSFDSGETINGYFSITGGDPIGETPTVLTTSAAVNGKNKLTPNVQPYYPSTGTVDIYALYPSDLVTSSTSSFSVKANQTDRDDYKLSDLMWAGISAQAKTTEDVNLTFAHKMAKMVITATGTEGVKIKAINLINTVCSIGLTASTGSLGALGSPTNAADKTIVVASSSETDGEAQLSGAALFPPQPINADFIEVVTNFGTTKFSVEKAFASGRQYTADLTITRQQIGFTTTITDWESDGGSIAVPPGSSAGLKIADIPDQEYNGSEIEPPMTITYTYNSNDYNLVKGQDYQLTFFNNKNIGTATVIINGLETAQAGIRDVVKKIRALKSFNITAATGNISYPNDNADKTVYYKYNGTVDNPLEKNGGDGKITYTSTVEDVATVSESGVVTIRKVGTTTIRAHMDGSGNYTEDDAEYKLIVKPRNIKEAVDAGEIVISLSNDEYTYTGQAFTPAVTVTDNGRTLLKDTHYDLDYNNNVNKGTAQVIVKGTENGNYDSSESAKAIKTFTINQGTPTLTIEQSAVTLPVGRTITRVAKNNIGEVRYRSSDNNIATVLNGVVTAVSPGNATIYAYIEHDNYGNYDDIEKSYSVEVVPSNWSYSYTGSVQTWPCPLSGIYQLEALGAQGAGCGGFAGGRGAQISGQLYIQKNQVLYIYVGQQGYHVTTTGASQGGWNGGGKYTGTNTAADASGYSSHNYCGGGGATDFALKSGDWDSSDHLNSRILVAGGGGGALYYEFMMVMSRNADGSEKELYTAKFTGGGGSGGAYAGEAGYGGSKKGAGGTLNAGGAVATGGTLASGGSFGSGGNYWGTLSAGMGGGGWYGGASGAYDAANDDRAHDKYSSQGSGGGGSSYIWNAENATYYNEHGTNNAPSIPSGSVMTDPSEFYITPTGMVEGARPGNGEARITYIGENW